MEQGNISEKRQALEEDRDHPLPPAEEESEAVLPGQGWGARCIFRPDRDWPRRAPPRPPDPPRPPGPAPALRPRPARSPFKAGSAPPPPGPAPPSRSRPPQDRFQAGPAPPLRPPPRPSLRTLSRPAPPRPSQEPFPKSGPAPHLTVLGCSRSADAGGFGSKVGVAVKPGFIPPKLGSLLEPG